MPASLSGRELFAILAAEIPGEAEADPLHPLRRALDFDPFLDRRIGALSAGMRQRLAIFAAFLGRPRAVILDEPFNWLDPICAFDTKEALKALVVGEQLTLVTALHETATLIRLLRVRPAPLRRPAQPQPRCGRHGGRGARLSGLRSLDHRQPGGEAGLPVVSPSPHRLKAQAMSKLEKPDLVTTNVRWRWPARASRRAQVRRHRRPRSRCCSGG